MGSEEAFEIDMDDTEDQDDTKDHDEGEDTSQIDYKQLLAEEKNRVEKIGADYKDIEKKHHQTIQALARFKGVLEGSGVGEITDDGEIKIFVKNTGNNQPDKVAEIKKELSVLKQSYENGDIDLDDYIDQRTEFKMQIGFEEQRKQQTKESKEKEQKNKQDQTIAQEEAKYTSLFMNLNKEYPDHNNESSLLYSEMAKVMQEEQHIFGDIDYTALENVRMRHLLAEKANNRLISKGVIKGKQRTNQAIQNFGTYNEDGYSKSEDQGSITDQQEILIRNLGITDKKVMKQIRDHAKSLNNGYELRIDI